MRVIVLLLLGLAVNLLSGCSQLSGNQQDEAAAVISAGPATVDRPPIVTDRFILESSEASVVGEVQRIYAQQEDTFVDIAREYNLGFDELRQANPAVDPWLPGEDTVIILPTQFILPEAGRDGIVINLAAKRLFFYPPAAEDGTRYVMTFPIGIGKSESPTPIGATTVVSKLADPVWYVPASIRAESAAEGNPLPPKVLPGPNNPLGKHMLGLGFPSYLLHGTNKPAGVGMQVSHGCVRLFPENIEFLYENAELGIPVEIVDQPYLVGWREEALYFESHPPLDGVREDEESVDALLELINAAIARAPNGRASVDMVRIGELSDAQRGFPVPVLRKSRDLQAVIEQSTVVNNLVSHPAIDTLSDSKPPQVSANN
ncbi:MAG: L,D-transpeptidase family protein [Gammaproteobacteria bacterium]